MTMRGLPPGVMPAAKTFIDPEAGPHAGMLLFIQYAFMPNRLDYCGTEDHGALFDYWNAHETDPGLAEILRTFTGALPYLKLIAHSNGIPDPFDRRVVEAYWIGNALLDGVNMQQFFTSLLDRFDSQLQGKARAYVTDKIPLGAQPHHSFHVFDVYSRVGHKGRSLEVMENCRVSWGTITAVEPAHFVIDAKPLVLQDGTLTLGTPASRRVLRKLDDNGFTENAQAGDWVSVHWNWACDVLTPAQVQQLERYTQHHIDLANLTI